jgi:hypothetical protein
VEPKYDRECCYRDHGNDSGFGNHGWNLYELSWWCAGVASLSKRSRYDGDAVAEYFDDSVLDR